MNLVQALLEAGCGGRSVQIDERLSEVSTNNITQMVFNKASGATIVRYMIPFLAKLDLGGHVAELSKKRRKMQAFSDSIIEGHRQRKKANADAAALMSRCHLRRTIPETR
ncbi:hypothetical protein R1flu_010604 [Riccia fluitans]|uniref:Uncharacterized protein n=1 Tax=Riccia fluitans TaxID=41844 RepID=A0ABD1Z5G2_9MARC